MNHSLAGISQHQGRFKTRRVLTKSQPRWTLLDFGDLTRTSVSDSTDDAGFATKLLLCSSEESYRACELHMWSFGRINQDRFIYLETTEISN